MYLNNLQLIAKNLKLSSKEEASLGNDIEKIYKSIKINIIKACVLFLTKTVTCFLLFGEFRSRQGFFLHLLLTRCAELLINGHDQNIACLPSLYQ